MRICLSRLTWAGLLVAILTVPTASLAQTAPQTVDVEGAAGAKLRASIFRPAGTVLFPL